jgi:hypothetical protein
MMGSHDTMLLHMAQKIIKKPSRYMNVIRIGSEFEGASADPAGCGLSFLPLALLAAPAHLRIFYLISAAGLKQKPLPQWVIRN